MTPSKNVMYSYLENNILILKYAGLWVTENYLGGSVYNLYSIIISALFVFSDNFCLVLNMPNILEDLDLERSSSYLTILSIKTMGCVKLVMFIRNRDIVHMVMDSLSFNCFRWTNRRQLKIMKESFGSYKIALRTFFVTGILSCLLFVLLPLILGQEKVLPFDSWYPYDTTKSHWYILTYIHQVVATMFITLTNVGIDTFSAGLMTVVSCQCELLADNILNFEGLRLVDEGIADFDEFFRKSAEHHRQILKLAKSLNELFSFYAFAQMSLCVLLFCTAMFRLSVVEPGRPEFFTIIVFITSIGVQLFLYCWFGNEVTVQSQKLHLAAFHCDWVGSPISFQKKLIFFLRKTADPIKIYALNFFPLSIVTFSMIMKNSWSFFAVLQQVHNRK